MILDAGFTEEDLREMVLRLAHEIRNPLATIKSAVQLIEHLQSPKGDVAEFHASIHLEIDRIDKVVRDMQRFVRLDLNTSSAKEASAIVRSAVELIASTATGSKADLEVAPGPDAKVLVDAPQVEAAFAELIDNAVRYSPPGEAIIVGWELPDERHVELFVVDRGPGVAPGQADRILRPFFSTSTQGTGLGLNIALRTAQIAGGTVTWQNLAAAGARFAIVLPRI